ncbi:MAG TPA: single-stranded DNA-binding protein [Streptosporangiaceae bacterium]|jgi:single-strand DNA-binding protein
MINGATVTLTGYVASEPNYRTIKGNTPIVSMRVAWTQRYVDRETGEWRDGNTSFATVNCWRKLANNVAPSLHKGQAVVVAGRLQIRENDDKEGLRRIYVEIDADAIGHNLSRGVSHFQRTNRPSEDATAEGAATDDIIEPGLTLQGGAGAGGNGTPGGSHEDLFERDAVAELAEAEEGSAPVAVPF